MHRHTLAHTTNTQAYTQYSKTICTHTRSHTTHTTHTHAAFTQYMHTPGEGVGAGWTRLHLPGLWSSMRTRVRCRFHHTQGPQRGTRTCWAAAAQSRSQRAAQLAHRTGSWERRWIARRCCCPGGERGVGISKVRIRMGEGRIRGRKGHLTTKKQNQGNTALAQDLCRQ